MLVKVSSRDWDRAGKWFWFDDRDQRPVLDPWWKFEHWGARLYALKLNNRLVCFAAMKFNLKFINIYLVYTPQEHRGKGYAAELVRQITEGQPIVKTTAQTEGGYALFRSLGYVEVGLDKHGSRKMCNQPS